VSSDKILFLDRNENSYGPAPACLNVLRSMTKNELSLYSRDFTRGVKSALSERLALDLRVQETQVLLGEGSEDLLKQAVHCYLHAGQKILCPAQSWWYYQALASEVGGETVTYSLNQGEDAFQYDVDEMIALYKKFLPRIVLIASPNNPTGNSFSGEQLAHIADTFRESVVILDEAYWGFGDSKFDSIPRFKDPYDNLIVLRTFSKFHALAGARIGFAVVGKNEERLMKFAARYLGHNRISEALALAALNSPDYYESVRQQVRTDRERYYRLFAEISGFKVFRSDANFVLVRLPADLKNSFRQFLSDRRIQLKYFVEPEFESFVRITIGTRAQNEMLMQAVLDFVATPAGGHRP